MANLCFVLVAVSLFGGHASSAADSSFDWRIIGGNKARDGQFPYQVSIQQNGTHRCGGSIIDKTTILSAAHCFYNRSMELKVAVGSNQLRPGGTLYDVKEIRYHEGYDFVSHMNDIAVVKLVSKLVYGRRVRPINVQQRQVNTFARCTVSGWGLTKKEYPNDLQYMYLRSITNEQCKERLGDRIRDFHLCTNNRIGKGVCYGDSGGALTSNGKIIGIASWVAIDCALGFPDVFTRVSFYADWIDKHSR